MSNENENMEVETQTEDNSAETPAALKNDKRLSDLMKQVTKWGEDSANGRDSLPKLAHAVVQAASDGVISATEKDKDGVDAAERIFEKYASAEGKKAVHERSAGGKKANISKLRQLIAMGAMTSIDAPAVMQVAFDTRKALEGSEGIKLKSSYAYYVDVARAQTKTNVPLTVDALEEIAQKPEPKSKELEDELNSILKKLEGLITGEAKHGLKDQHELTEVAYNAIKDRIDALTLVRKQEEFRAKAEELGLELA